MFNAKNERFRIPEKYYFDFRIMRLVKQLRYNYSFDDVMAHRTNKKKKGFE